MKTSIISLAVASVIYVGLFWFVGYLAIPIGVVISGYVKNYLLGRACRRRGLAKIDGRTVRAIFTFGMLAAALGVGLWFIPINSIFALAFAIAGYGIIYMPIAFLINRKI